MENWELHEAALCPYLSDFKLEVSLALSTFPVGFSLAVDPDPGHSTHSSRRERCLVVI